MNDVDSGDLAKLWRYAVLRMCESQELNALSRELALHSELIDFSNHIALIRTDVKVLTMPHVCKGLQTALRGFYPDIRLIVEVGAAANKPADAFASAPGVAKDALQKASRK